VLPYYEDLNLSKVNGVNYYDINMNYTSSNYSKCEFVTTNLVFNDKLEESNENKKHLKCYQYGSKILGENFGDTKNYCYYHKQQIIKTKKEEIKQKLKEEKQKLKEATKQKIKEEKQQLKELIKEAKQKIKKIKKEIKQDKTEELKKDKTNENNEENVVLGNIVIDSTQEHVLCIQILKTGTSKGTQCCKKVFNEHLCKRHYNLQNK
jgi:vacuolar-type H+-ATPase subunit I/STV1